ncbi:MAG TPA: RnfABCDGE type electron transport complex subunit D, partial [Bacillota bacterium]|nr:RnfABCDGE type electron transport complex subunit D [Bacillota bacterium]
GWMATLGANFGLGHGVVDFAGSAVVHSMGGMIALAGAIVIGPRIGKFKKDGTARAFPGHDIPMAIIGTTFLYGLIAEGSFYLGVYHVVAGGVMIGALFMATDWVTSPITPKGKLIFGVCIGLLLMTFRVFLAPTEGMAFSILIMNACVPLIDRLTKRPKFGEVQVKEEKTAPAAAKPAVGKSN